MLRKVRFDYQSELRMLVADDMTSQVKAWQQWRIVGRVVLIIKPGFLAFEMFNHIITQNARPLKFHLLRVVSFLNISMDFAEQNYFGFIQSMRTIRYSNGA